MYKKIKKISITEPIPLAHLMAKLRDVDVELLILHLESLQGGVDSFELRLQLTDVGLQILLPLSCLL
jgi:hypothetical protein